MSIEEGLSGRAYVRVRGWGGGGKERRKGEKGVCGREGVMGFVLLGGVVLREVLLGVKLG